jgi:hypothetical protein
MALAVGERATAHRQLLIRRRRRASAPLTLVGGSLYDVKMEYFELRRTGIGPLAVAYPVTQAATQTQLYPASAAGGQRRRRSHVTLRQRRR